MDVHPTKNVSIGIDPYPIFCMCQEYQCNIYTSFFGHTLNYMQMIADVQEI